MGGCLPAALVVSDSAGPAFKPGPVLLETL